MIEIWNSVKSCVKFSWKSLEILTNCVKLFKILSEIFLKIERNYLEYWVKFFFNLVSFSCKLHDIFLKIEWNCFKGTSTLCRTAHSGTAWQKSRHAASICGHCLSSAAACCSMLHSLKIWSANCRSHQRKPRGIWWVRGFKMVSASLRKKIRQHSLVSFHSFVTWRRCTKDYFFMWTRSHWRHMPSNFSRATKLRYVAFCRAA